MIQTQSVLYTSITRMLTKTHLRCVLLVVCTIVNATLLAQNFQVAGGIPYFPAYTNTSYVTLSPIPTGAVIYDKSKSQLQLYTGSAWVSLCSANIPSASNVSASFRIMNGIPVLSVTNLSSPATAGATYLNTSGNIYVGDGSAWNTLGNYMNKTNVPTTNPARMGAVAGTGSALVIPVLSAAPTATAAGAAYFDAATANLKVYSGTAWLTVGCNLPSAINVTGASGSIYSGSSFTGTYNYYQNDPLPEGSSIYRWYSANDGSGSGKTLIATTKSYTIPSGIAGKYIAFGVTPVTNTGLTGNEVLSSWKLIQWQCGEVLNKVHYAGSVAPVYASIGYGTVSINGVCWITRNLGATQQPTGPYDSSSASSGWYWQYGYAQGFTGYGSPASSYWNAGGKLTSWSIGNDPCNLLLGGSWHIPDISQLESLRTSTLGASWTSAYSSVMKMAAGKRLKYYATFDYTDEGRWWSRTYNSGNYGWRLWIGGWINTTDDEYWDNGLNIRCCY